MSVLSAYFNRRVNQCSPSRGDVQRVVKYDEDGSEHITYEPVNYPAKAKSRGVVRDWSLKNLIKAGIDPSFPVHTGYSTRLAGVDAVNAAAAMVEKEFASETEPEPKSE